MLQIDIGDDSNFPADDIVPLNIGPGKTVTVKNVAGGTISYWSGLDNASADGTITTGNSQSFTSPPVYLTASSRTSIQITGQDY